MSTRCHFGIFWALKVVDTASLRYLSASSFVIPAPPGPRLLLSRRRRGLVFCYPGAAGASSFVTLSILWALKVVDTASLRVLLGAKGCRHGVTSVSFGR